MWTNRNIPDILWFEQTTVHCHRYQQSNIVSKRDDWNCKAQGKSPGQIKVDLRIPISLAKHIVRHPYSQTGFRYHLLCILLSLYNSRRARFCCKPAVTQKEADKFLQNMERGLDRSLRAEWPCHELNSVTFTSLLLRSQDNTKGATGPIQMHSSYQAVVKSTETWQHHNSLWRLLIY